MEQKKASDYVYGKIQQLIKAVKEGDEAMVAAMEARICVYVDNLEKAANCNKK